ncbi:unnamed protein product [Zymoseptoria tritici ST99CH_1A5]|uniref:Integrase catalytic domain-containing protein n=1 Tax=Zymoseptoria tritici ST99CH_1A5 TaxID=1276529 RepID=A0A1Y6L631_ZYMTR|nr:unnamed protein product [Zymoseptoria tritici ST99CH_1A5]
MSDTTLPLQEETCAQCYESGHEKLAHDTIMTAKGYRERNNAIDQLQLTGLCDMTLNSVQNGFLHTPVVVTTDSEHTPTGLRLEQSAFGDPTDQDDSYALHTDTRSSVFRDAWILDSGANLYVANDPKWFIDLRNFEMTVRTADDSQALRILGGGTVLLNTIDGEGNNFELQLSNVAYAPNSRCNLLSTSKLAKAGIVGSWEADGEKLFTPEFFHFATAEMKNGLYHVRLSGQGHYETEPQIPIAANVDFDHPVWTWHRRLGHLSLERMRRLCSQSSGLGVTAEQIKGKLGAVCPICATTRAIVRIPRDPARSLSTRILYRIHVDIWGPYPVSGWDRTRFFLFITDDFTRRTWDERLEDIEDMPNKLRHRVKQLERKYGETVVFCKGDNAFNQGPWKAWADKKGIQVEPSVPYAHHQAGRAERVHRTIREGAGTLIQETQLDGQISKVLEEEGDELLRNSTLGEDLWPEAIHHATWLKARSPTRTLKWKKTPWEASEGVQPDLTRERIWGSRVYVTWTPEERLSRGINRKLHDNRGWLGYFVGYENESSYRVWSPDRATVVRVVYARVDDGVGLDDSQSGQRATERRERLPREDYEDDSDDPQPPEFDDDSDHDESDDGEKDDNDNQNPATVRSESRSRPTTPVPNRETEPRQTTPEPEDETDDEERERRQEAAWDNPGNDFMDDDFDDAYLAAMAEKRKALEGRDDSDSDKSDVARRQKRRAAGKQDVATTTDTFTREKRKHIKKVVDTDVPVPPTATGAKRTSRKGKTILLRNMSSSEESDDDVDIVKTYADRDETNRNSQVPLKVLAAKCYCCFRSHRACNGTAPFDVSCSVCKDMGWRCVSQEFRKREKTMPKCVRCESTGMECDRLQPCHQCKKSNRTLCTYKSASGDRTISTILKPQVPGKPGTNKANQNVDWFEEDNSSCQNCRRTNKGCIMEAGAMPCWHCVRLKSAKKCVIFPEPGKVESITTAFYELAIENGNNVVAPAANPVLPTRKAYGSAKKRDLVKKKTALDSSSEDEDEDSDVARRQKRKAPVKRKTILDSSSENENKDDDKNNKPDAFHVDNGTVDLITLAAYGIPINWWLAPEPQSYNEAVTGGESSEWLEAIQDEYNSLLENETWTVVDLPKGRKPLTTKWVLKRKLKPSGGILKRKARMVARGFQQVEGFDFTETYSGVVKSASYRSLFALAALYGWHVHQMDVSTAFLNGDLEEEVYIQPPEGYPEPGKVLRLKKALYGLKQAPRAWYKKFRTWLLQQGWIVSEYDECVFYHPRSKLVLTVYVDDINIFGSDLSLILAFKRDISARFKMTDEGEASFYLGIEINRTGKDITLRQTGFAQQILNKYGIASKGAHIPLNPLKKLTDEVNSTADKDFRHLYMSMVGSLNYLQTKTRVDLSFPTGFVARFNKNPNQDHMDAVQGEYNYLSTYPAAGLHFKHMGSKQVEGFVDSDWGGCKSTGRSTTGWIYTLAGSAISWSSQRQKTVSTSSTEAEYIAASEACKEAVWLKGYLNEIARFAGTQKQGAIPLMIDNMSAIKLTKNPEFHGRTKHIDIRHHFIRECVTEGHIAPTWIAGTANPADALTKPLPKTSFAKTVAAIGLIDGPSDDPNSHRSDQSLRD